jgi:hypothetical protein
MPYFRTTKVNKVNKRRVCSGIAIQFCKSCCSLSFVFLLSLLWFVYYRQTDGQGFHLIKDHLSFFTNHKSHQSQQKYGLYRNCYSGWLAVLFTSFCVPFVPFVVRKSILQVSIKIVYISFLSFMIKVYHIEVINDSFGGFQKLHITD